MFGDDIKELDQKLNPTSDGDDTEPILLPPPTAKEQKTIDEVKLPSNKPRESYWSGFISTVLEKVVKPFRGVYPFTNMALNCDCDFDLNIEDAKGLMDKHLMDFIGMKQKEADLREKILAASKDCNIEIVT